MKEVTEFKPEGTKNLIRKGDRIRVLSDPKGGVGSQGFQAKAMKIMANDDGEVEYIEVYRPKGGFRCIRVERVRRMEQTRNGERIEVR